MLDLKKNKVPIEHAEGANQSHTPTRPSIFAWSACLYNEAETLPSAVTACALQPALFEVVLISREYVHVCLCEWNTQTSSTFY